MPDWSFEPVSLEIATQPLSAARFAPFGDVLDFSGAPEKLINQGLCGRYHDRAKLTHDGGRAGISLFDAVPRQLPYHLQMMERHPSGSQAFLPMTEAPFLVIVAPDDNGRPGLPEAFLTEPHVGVNYHANVWHGVLTPLSAPGRFAVIDRIGPGANLEEYWFDEAYVITV